MDRIHVMELVRSFQVGEMGRSASLAQVLVEASLSSPVKHPRPVVETRAAAGPVPGVSGGRISAPAQAGDGRVEYPGPQGATLEGYLARPIGTRPKPGVIVIQEWWGVNEHIRDVTRRLANEGFLALAPDLYHGVVVSEPDEARKQVMELDMNNAVREIRQAVVYLLSRDDVTGPKVGIVGFCMGGRLVLQTARVEPDLGAAVSFYGTPLGPAEAAEVKAPILGLYGTEDRGNPLDKVRAMEKALTGAGIENQIRIYEGAQHAFFNDTRAAYDQQSAADAWQRTLAWFRGHLGRG